MPLGDVEDGGAQPMGDGLGLRPGRYFRGRRLTGHRHRLVLLGRREADAPVGKQPLEGRARSAVGGLPILAGKPVEQAAAEDHDRFVIGGRIAARDQAVGERLIDHERVLPAGRIGAAAGAAHRLDGDPGVAVERQRAGEVVFPAATGIRTGRA